ATRRVSGDADEDVPEVLPGIDAGAPAALDQRVDDGGGFTAAAAAGEEPVLAAHRDRANRPLARVVVERHAAVQQEGLQRPPAVEQVLHGVCHRASRAEEVLPAAGPPEHAGEDRPGLLATEIDATIFVQTELRGLGVELVERADVVLEEAGHAPRLRAGRSKCTDHVRPAARVHELELGFASGSGIPGIAVADEIVGGDALHKRREILGRSTRSESVDDALHLRMHEGPEARLEPLPSLAALPL